MFMAYWWVLVLAAILLALTVLTVPRFFRYRAGVALILVGAGVVVYALFFVTTGGRPMFLDLVPLNLAGFWVGVGLMTVGVLRCMVVASRRA
jgi:hypothetical protein